VFKRFESKELSPYRSLIQEYALNWKGDRESDKKLLGRLTTMLKKVPTLIADFIDKQIDKNNIY
jgi:hypothetical protein